MTTASWMEKTKLIAGLIETYEWELAVWSEVWVSWAGNVSWLRVLQAKCLSRLG